MCETGMFGNVRVPAISSKSGFPLNGLSAVVSVFGVHSRKNLKGSVRYPIRFLVWVGSHVRFHSLRSTCL